MGLWNWNAAPTDPEDENSPIKCTCPVCGGSGRVPGNYSREVNPVTGREVEIYEMVTCDECGGAGEVTL